MPFYLGEGRGQNKDGERRRLLLFNCRVSSSVFKSVFSKKGRKKGSLQLALCSGSCLPATHNPRHLNSPSTPRLRLSARPAGAAAAEGCCSNPGSQPSSGRRGSMCTRAGTERAAVEGCGPGGWSVLLPRARPQRGPGLGPPGRSRAQATRQGHVPEIGQDWGRSDAWPRR